MSSDFINTVLCWLEKKKETVIALEVCETGLEVPQPLAASGVETDADQ
jgi:hypothetical protein